MFDDYSDRLLAPLFVFLLLLLTSTSVLAQTHIREKVDITKQAVDSVNVSQHLPSAMFPTSAGSGIVIPRSSGLRTRLEIYYSQLERLDEAIPFWARLLTLKRDTTLSDTVYSRFPSLLINPETFQDVCGTWGTQHNKYLYFPTAATELCKAGKISPGDTIRFGYITERVREHVRDTLGIYSCDTVRLVGDTTIVGWNVAFADYNNCLNTWNDKLDVFVGMNCTEYTRLFGQGDALWGSHHYLYSYAYQKVGDSVVSRTPNTISKKGCALTSLALALKANDVDTDPGRLNTFMKDTTLFDWTIDSSSVRWETPNFILETPFVFLRQFGTSISKDKPEPPHIPIDTLGYYLDRCMPVLVNVSNPPGAKKTHWVLVSGRDSTGRYTIVDPGYANRSTLADYNNVIYKVVIYKKS